MPLVIQKLHKVQYNTIKRGKKMKKVRWITGKLYTVKEFAEIIWHDQARNPFCDRIDNQGYMESVAWSVENCGLDPLPEGSIKLDSIDNFVKSLCDNGLIEIIET